MRHPITTIRHAIHTILIHIEQSCKWNEVSERKLTRNTDVSWYKLITFIILHNFFVFLILQSIGMYFPQPGSGLSLVVFKVS
jgi:hypothetical protein